MWSNVSLFGALHLAGCCLAIGSVSTSLPPASATSLNVPTGVVVGDYAGQYRPQMHFSPPQNFMNDPCGLFRDANGTWHLYYQLNPIGTVAGNQHWGHATSNDLYHWTNQRIAIGGPRDKTYIFTGSAVVDVNNTSGLFPNQTDGVVAIFTLNDVSRGDRAGRQTQEIAYSHDGGYTFTYYEHNPVIASNSSQFRDPKVLWYEDHWVMTVAYAQEFAIGIFTSPNLIDWTHASNFSYHGLLGMQWECPNLVRTPYYDAQGHLLDTMWTFYVNVNPGAPVGGSITEYFPGSFNGTHFEPVDSVARLADFGKDNYARQFFFGLPDDQDPVYIAWASNWQYSQAVPTAQENWRSAMTLPRRTYLVKADRIGWKMVSAPFNMQPILGENLLSKQNHVNGTVMVDFSSVESNAVYWEVNITGVPKDHISDKATLNFTLLSSMTGEYVRGGYYLGGDLPFYLDRGGVTGFDHVFFTDKFSINSLPVEDKWSMSGVFDRSLIEVFLNGGIDDVTASLYSQQPLTLLTISSTDLPEGARVSIRVDALKGGWADMASEDGLVYGNQTAPNIGVEHMQRLLPVM